LWEKNKNEPTTTSPRVVGKKKSKKNPIFLGCKMPGYPITLWLGQNFALIQGLHK